MLITQYAYKLTLHYNNGASKEFRLGNFYTEDEADCMLESLWSDRYTESGGYNFYDIRLKKGNARISTENIVGIQMEKDSEYYE